MSRRGPWSVLGIDATSDKKIIRRAYAAKLKLLDIDREAAQYALLRDARDMALHLAKVREENPEAGEFVEPADEYYGDTALGADWHGPDLDVVARSEEIAGPEAGRASYSETTSHEKLHELLFPGTEYSAEPFNEDEYEQACLYLDEITSGAMAGDLEQQQSTNYWLADRLATAWPRSSMLVEQASTAFDWVQEAGRLGEGAAQAYLLDRLQGLKFYEELQQPYHWGHKAWKELSKPGTKGFLGRFRASKDDITNLLAQIRQNYPELETYLDQEKVSSWDEPIGSPWGISGILFLLFDPY